MRKTNKKQRSLTAPIMLQGESYKPKRGLFYDGKGNQVEKEYYEGPNDSYYTFDDNYKAVPLLLFAKMSPEEFKKWWNTAPNSPVAKSKDAPRENLLSKQFNDYLTLSNDNTQVNNVPHREYNSHLRDAAIRGAKDNALWEKKHPNATAWRNVFESVPFAVAAYPFAVGAGDALAATSVGQSVSNGLNMIANTAKGSTVLPWADAAVTSVFGAQGLQDVKNGNFTPETAMDLMPLGRLAKPMYETGRGMFDLGRSIFNFNKTRNTITPNVTSEEPVFVSELDWSPESWFGRYRPGGQFDAEDVAALKSHLPEYYQIEQQARTNGTWMKDANGKMLAMDPREWVIRQSKDYKAANLTGKRHYTGVAGEKAMNYSYNGDAWTDLEKNISQSFKETHTAVDGKPGVLLQLDYPKSSKKVVFDSKNHIWYDLPKDNFIEGYPQNTYDATANEAVRQAQNQGFDVSQFNNIKEGNDNIVTDVIIHSGTPRKSVLGNNGNFDMSNLNIYKALAPFAIPITLANKK